jgi:hypothetical protein
LAKAAVGAGGIIMSHLNDAGFQLIIRRRRRRTAVIPALSRDDS